MTHTPFNGWSEGCQDVKIHYNNYYYYYWMDIIHVQIFGKFREI